MQTKCVAVWEFAYKSNDEDLLVTETFGCLPKTKEANSSQLCHSPSNIKPNSSFGVLLPYGV